MRPGAVPDGRSGGQNRGQRRHRSDSTFNFEQRQWHAAARGACHCQERIRQLVVFTPGSCPRQPAQTLGRNSKYDHRITSSENVQHAHDMAESDIGMLLGYVGCHSVTRGSLLLEQRRVTGC